MRERAAAPDKVFPETRLALMHPQARAARKRSRFVSDGRTLLVHAMSCLVHGRIDGHDSDNGGSKRVVMRTSSRPKLEQNGCAASS